MRHLNLMPVERRRGLRRGLIVAALTRFVVSIVIGLGMMTLVGLTLGSGLWVMTFTESRLAEIELNQEVESYRQLRLVIVQQNDMLADINNLAGEPVVWSELLSDLLVAVPAGATVESLHGNTTTAKLSFSGQALTRSDVVLLEERVRALSWAKGVVAPRTNLLTRDKPSYNFTLLLGESQESSKVE